MIIYENTIKSFQESCLPMNVDKLISEIKSNMHLKLGRGVSTSEERSWRTTLVKISKLFEVIKNKTDQYILLEFKVPTTQKRIDVILAGSNGSRKTLLIIELKGWSSSKESENPQTLEINSRYRYVSHPNYEADEYKYLLTEQFSDINEEFKHIQAISLLPNYDIVENDPIIGEQFSEILKKIKLYTKTDIEDFKKLLTSLFQSGIPRKSVHFLNKLEYKPTLNFQKHLEKQFKEIPLSSSQRIAYNKIIHQIDLHIKNKTSDNNNKKLIVISGMPGSGKTVIAFKVLAYIYAKKKMTAKLQLPGPEFREGVKRTYPKNAFASMIGGAYSKSESELVIIDEAHKAYGQGTSKQFYNEIFKHQNFVVALIDDKQVVNKKGFLKSNVIDIAKKNMFDIVELELFEQFRNAGDSLYIDWLNNWIFNENEDQENYQDYYVDNAYQFLVLEDSDFNKMYKEYYKNHNVRMISFWTQGWNAYFDEHGMPERRIRVGSSKYIWNPNQYWEKAFKDLNPYGRIPSQFKKNVLNKNFNKDKKGYEYIAYFNTTQGSEFDYIFVHIPKLFFLNKNNELDVNLDMLDFTDMKSQIWMKNKAPNPEKEELNKRYFKNRLLVNLTRGTKGTIIYCEDKKLSNWIKEKILKK